MALVLIVFVAGMQASAATMAAARQARMAMARTMVSMQAAAVGQAAAGTIEVAAGTKVPLNLVTQIMSLSTKPGATVRAMVAFPVTVGNQVAIPAGTFVEGKLISAAAKSATKKTRYGSSGAKVNASSGLQIHFTKLVYANGYTVPLDAQNEDASVRSASDAEVASVQMLMGPREDGPDGGAAFIEGQYPPLPPLPPLPQQHVGPNPVAVTLGAIGGFVLITLGAVLLAKHHVSRTDEVLYDAGWQFSMALTSPLQLDKAQVMDAARMAPATP